MGRLDRAFPARLGVLSYRQNRSGAWLLLISLLVLAAACFSGLFRQQLPSALLTIFFFLDSALFLLPGFAFASAFSVRRSLTVCQVVVLIIATSSTLGFISFWAFFFSKLLGKVFSFAVYLSSASVFIPAVRRRTAVKSISKLVAEPFLYAALAGLCYVCFFFLFVDPLTSGADHAYQRFFDQIRPGDNVIPLIFAEKIYGRQPLRPFCCGDWLSSDRPPLQTGIFLLQRTLRFAGNVRLHYELLALALQCLWICGVWCLLKVLGSSRTRIRQALGLLIFSGFLFYNSVYTWPKLLAAACLLFALSVVFEAVGAGRGISQLQTILSAACVGLALMAHPGSIFSLPAAVVFVFRFRRLFALRQLTLALCVISVFGLPWIAYQKFVDPPGNRLLKMHLAGEGGIDDRSTWRAISDAYAGHTAKELTGFKLSNIVTLAGRKPFDTFGLGDITLRSDIHIDHSATERSRIAQREWIWNAVGILNIGWLAWLIRFLKRKGLEPAIAHSGWMIAAAMGNLLLWSLLTFGPNSTITTHSSYADTLLLSIGLLGFVLTLPGLLRAALLVLQMFNLLVVWVWSPPKTFFLTAGKLAGPVLQWPLLLFGGLLALALLLHLGRSHLAERSPRE